MPTYSTTATTTGTTSYTYTFSTPWQTTNTWNTWSPSVWVPIAETRPDRPRRNELPSFGDDFIEAMIGGGSDE